MKVLLVGNTGMIGTAISEELQARGHQVQGVSRKSDPGVDISKPEALKNFLEEMDEVDAIICTGGGAHIGATLDDITDEQIYQGIHSKMMGQVNLIRWGTSKVKSGGSIIISGGLFGFKAAFPNSSQIGMVNAGLNGFVLNIANDWKDKGVKINIIHPPFIRETAEMFGFPGDALPPKADCAKFYVDTLGNEGTGQGLFMPGYGPDD